MIVVGLLLIIILLLFINEGLTVAEMFYTFLEILFFMALIVLPLVYFYVILK